MNLQCPHHGPPQGRKYEYVAGVAPLGYPETAIRCTRSGKNWCKEPALVYLNTGELEEFQNGERVFTPPGRGVKFKVSDEVVWRDR